jgi:hypothetical protein
MREVGWKGEEACDWVGMTGDGDGFEEGAAAVGLV